MKASILTDEAIEYGLSQLKFYLSKPDIFKAFFDVATDYSKLNSLHINWTGWYNSKIDHSMPVNAAMTQKKAIEQPTIESKYYTHKEIELDHNDECRKWHEMVMNWDNIVDPKKKCAKGYELTYPGYTEWLKKISLTTFLDSNPPDVLVYMDESKLTLLDAMRKA